MYQYIRPAKVLAALQWLKSNNPLYRDTEINDWLSDAVEDDAELWEALSAGHCPPPPSLPTVTITASSHGRHFVLQDCIIDIMYLWWCVFAYLCSVTKVDLHSKVDERAL